MSTDDENWRAAGRELVGQGQPERALGLYQERYRAARESPTAANTEGSAILTAWADLARTHAPALEALHRLRRAAVQRLRGAQDESGPLGEPSHGMAALDDFTEVAAISARVGEPEYPVELFTDLDANQPAVAEDCAAQARRHLVRAGKFDLARRYLGDPLEVVDRMGAVFEQRLTRGFSHAPEGMRSALRARAVDQYLTGVREILTVLSGVGEDDLTDQVRRQAIAAVPWAHVRDDVETALETPTGSARSVGPG